jgi:hypothetical protein
LKNRANNYGTKANNYGTTNMKVPIVDLVDYERKQLEENRQQLIASERKSVHLLLIVVVINDFKPNDALKAAQDIYKTNFII